MKTKVKRAPTPDWVAAYESGRETARTWSVPAKLRKKFVAWCRAERKSDGEPPWWIVIFYSWPELHASMEGNLVVDGEQAWWKGFVEALLDSSAN